MYIIDRKNKISVTKWAQLFEKDVFLINFKVFFPKHRIPVSPLADKSEKIRGAKWHLLLFYMYYSYILKSVITSRHYYGSTSSLDTRSKSHNSGKVSSTKVFRPSDIYYHEKYSSKTETLKRELFFKSIDGYNRKISPMLASGQRDE